MIWIPDEPSGSNLNNNVQKKAFQIIDTLRLSLVPFTVLLLLRLPRKPLKLHEIIPLHES